MPKRTVCIQNPARVTEKQYANHVTLVCSGGYRPETVDPGAQMTLLL